jgi:Zn-dependent protease with chaperone function
MSVVAVIQLIALAAFSFALLFGSVASCSAPLVLARTACWAPEYRHRALLLASVAPTVLAAFGVLAVLAPSLLALAWPEYDHCLRHDDHHVHLCLIHWPRHLGNLSSWFVLAIAVGWTLVQAARALAELYRAWRCAAQLRLHGHGDAEMGANILPTGAPLCLLAGVFRPTLFLSRGLLAGVEPAHVAIILHHERAHAARQDILLRLVARAGTVFMWPSARAGLLAALELAAEQSCDEVAASRVGDRLQVAEAILGVERLLQKAASTLSPLAVAFGGDTVPQRVAALLEPPRASGNVVLLASAFATLLCGVLAASEPLHHLTESLLGALVH